MLAFDVREDGTLTNRRHFGEYRSLTVRGHKDPLLAEDNGADGLAIDNEGRVVRGHQPWRGDLQPAGTAPRRDSDRNLGRRSVHVEEAAEPCLCRAGQKTLYTVGANAISGFGRSRRASADAPSNAAVVGRVLSHPPTTPRRTRTPAPSTPGPKGPGLRTRSTTPRRRGHRRHSTPAKDPAYEPANNATSTRTPPPFHEPTVGRVLSDPPQRHSGLR